MEKLPQINEERNLRSRNDWEGRLKTPLTTHHRIYPEIRRPSTEAYDIDTDKLDAAALAILSLTLHEGSRVWKGIDWDISGRRDYTRAGQGEIKKTPTYTHELLCNELTSKSMVPYISTVTAREVSEYDDWVRHNVTVW